MISCSSYIHVFRTILDISEMICVCEWGRGGGEREGQTKKANAKKRNVIASSPLLFFFFWGGGCSFSIVLLAACIYV